MGATKCKELFLRELRNVKNCIVGGTKTCIVSLQGSYKGLTSGSQGSYKGLTKKYVKNCYKMPRIVLWELRNVKTGVVGATKCKELYCGSYEILCFYRRCSLSIGVAPPSLW